MLINVERFSLIALKKTKKKAAWSKIEIRCTWRLSPWEFRTFGIPCANKCGRTSFFLMQLHKTWDRPCFLLFFLESPLLQKRPRWLRLYRSDIAWLSHVVLACVTLEVCATDFPHIGNIGSRANTCCPWCILTPSLTQSAHSTHRSKHTHTHMAHTHRCTRTYTQARRWLL